MLDKDCLEVTLADVRAFCLERQPESGWLDYKKDLSSANATLQVAKLVSAMANTHGGWILFGVAENGQDEQHRGLPGDLVGVDASRSVAESIRKACLSSVRPPVFPQVQVLPLETDIEKQIIVVRIHESDSAPHSLVKDGKTYIRVEDISHPVTDQEATTDQIEFLLNRRQKSIAKREGLLRRAKQRYEINEVYPQLLISAVPTFPHEPLADFNYLVTAANNTRELSLLSPIDPFRTAHETCWGKTPDSSSNTTYIEFGVYGLMFIRQRLQADQPGLRYQVGVKHVCRTIFNFVEAMGAFYESIVYRGLIDLDITFHHRERSTVFSFGDGDLTPVNPDTSFTIHKRALLGELVTDSNLEDLFRQFMWSCGVGTGVRSSPYPAELVADLRR